MLLQVGTLGTQWEITPIPISGNPYFDFFFSLMLACGIMAMILGWLFNVVNRS